MGDNVGLHCFEGGQALPEWLDSFRVTLIYLPIYFPEPTPVELIFNKMKTVLQRYAYRDLLRFYIDVAIYRALHEISVSDSRGFMAKLGTSREYLCESVPRKYTIFVSNFILIKQNCMFSSTVSPICSLESIPKSQSKIR